MYTYTSFAGMFCNLEGDFFKTAISTFDAESVALAKGLFRGACKWWDFE